MTEDRDHPLLTQCPGCQTVFRITGAILRAAHGQVRCGRCNTQFDALQNVFDHEELIAEQPANRGEAEKTAYLPSHDRSADDATAFMPSEFDSAAATHEQITMEGDRFNAGDAQRSHDEHTQDDTGDDSIIEIFNIDAKELDVPLPSADAAGVEPQAEPFAATHSDSHGDELTRVRQQFFGEAFQESSGIDDNDEPAVRADATGDSAEAFNEAIYMTGLDHALEEDHENIQPEFMLDEESGESSSDEAGHEPAVAEKTRVRRWASSGKSRRQQQPPPDVLEPDLYEEIRPSRWPLSLACFALMLLLAVQVIHHYRQTLVRHPGFGPALKSIYAMLGQKLEPRWELNAYSIKQWGIVSDPQETGVLRVRASITNNAPFAQPYPLLKLTLEDRFGTHLGMRAFKPAEYLPNAASASHLLESGMAANVDLAIVDPGEEAVGFQFDSCLGDEHSMRCAHD
ncbi:MAG: zinc-ribbon and DUF3426 domain-containing protein [Steroidobacter sp.]